MQLTPSERPSYEPAPSRPMTIEELVETNTVPVNPVDEEQRPELFRLCVRQHLPVVGPHLERLLSALYLYAEQQDGPLDTRKGILLSGPCGIGKSATMKALALYQSMRNGRRNGYPVGGFNIVSAPEIATECFYDLHGTISRYTRRERPVRICIDDVGKETIQEENFRVPLNVVQAILNARYEIPSKAVTHMTTNLTFAELEQRYGTHVADRMNQMFNIVRLEGRSYR